jgi:hypothetical protein
MCQKHDLHDHDRESADSKPTYQQSTEPENLGAGEPEQARALLARMRMLCQKVSRFFRHMAAGSSYSSGIRRTH